MHHKVITTLLTGVILTSSALTTKVVKQLSLHEDKMSSDCYKYQHYCRPKILLHIGGSSVGNAFEIFK